MKNASSACSVLVKWYSNHSYYTCKFNVVIANSYAGLSEGFVQQTVLRVDVFLHFLYNTLLNFWEWYILIKNDNYQKYYSFYFNP
jgi:hypothetical protein